MDAEGDVEIKWIFSAEVLEQLTPSREKGISPELERRYRREGARFVMNASNTLKLFFMVQSFTDFNRFVVGASCVLLAGKVEETPKKCRDIVRVSKSILTNDQYKAFGDKPIEELIATERVLLQTIRFDLQVHHPYNYLLDIAKNMKGEKQRIEQVLQMAWTFINDSLCTTLCLQWEPSVVAVALLYLAGKLSKFDLQTAFQSKNRSWWRQFVATVDTHDLESICHQVLDVYSEEEQKEQSSPVKTESVEKSEPVVSVSQENTSSSEQVTTSFPSQYHLSHTQNSLPYMAAASPMSVGGQSNLMGVAQTGQIIPPTQTSNLIRPPLGTSPAAALMSMGGVIPTHHSMLHQGVNPPTSINIQQQPQSVLGQYHLPQPLLPLHMMYSQNVPVVPGGILPLGTPPQKNSPFQHYVTPPSNVYSAHGTNVIPVTSTSHMSNYNTPTGTWR